MPFLCLVILLGQFLGVGPGRITEPYTFIGLDDPDEVLRISEDRLFEGRLVLLGRSRLEVEEAALTVTGTLLIGNQAQLTVRQGALKLDQPGPGRHEIICTDEGRLRLEESTLGGEGQPVGVTLLDRSAAVVQGGAAAGRLEWEVADGASLSLVSFGQPGEVTVRGEAAAHLEHCPDAWIWLTVPAGESVRLADVRGGDLELWQGRLLGEAGAALVDVTLRHCPRVRFGVELQDQGRLDLDQCDLAALRLIFSAKAGEPIVVRDLRAIHDAVWDLDAEGWRLHAEGSGIGAWEVVAAGDAEVRLYSSRDLRRLQGRDEGTLLVFDSRLEAVDASLLGEGRSTLGLIRCRLEGSMSLAEHSLATWHDCEFGERASVTVGGFATGAALNYGGEMQPRLFKEGALLEASLADIVAEAGQTVEVAGWARLHTAAAESPVAADLLLQYRPMGPDQAWREITLLGETRFGVLGRWETGSMRPGDYRLRLTTRTARVGALAVQARVRLEAPRAAGTPAAPMP